MVPWLQVLAGRFTRTKESWYYFNLDLFPISRNSAFLLIYEEIDGISVSIDVEVLVKLIAK